MFFLANKMSDKDMNHLINECSSIDNIPLITAGVKSLIKLLKISYCYRTIVIQPFNSSHFDFNYCVQLHREKLSGIYIKNTYQYFK